MRLTDNLARLRGRGTAKSLRGALAAVATMALVSSGVFLTTPNAAQAADATSGTVTGKVFRDFNSNGAFDSGNTAKSGKPNDAPMAGIAVTAFDRDGDPVGSTTSGANGKYSISVAGAASNDLRIEFGSLKGFESSFAGADSGTSEQFVTLSNGAATSVDYAVNAPGDFSSGQQSPAVVTTIQAPGVPDSAASVQNAQGAFNVVVANAWSDQVTAQTSGQYPGRNVLATFSEVGAVGSALVAGEGDRVLVASTYKRMSGLKNGIDTMYVIPTVKDDKNVKRSGDITSFNLNGLAIAGSADTLDLGTALTNAERGLAGPATMISDADPFERAALIGVGGMTLSSDGKSLYFVNLNDKNLYVIDISGLPETAPVEAKRIELGLGAGERAYAVTYHHGDVYVGAVTTGETANGFMPGRSAQSAGLTYTVKRAAERDLSTQPAWATVARDSLGYAKGNPLASWGSGTPATANPQITRWNTWTDKWDWNGANAGSVGFNITAPLWPGDAQAYPQPLLSGLAFDTEGFMQLAFTDRTDLQSGNRNLAAHGSETTLFETIVSGDLLIAGANAARDTFTLEKNGAVSGHAYGATATSTRNASVKPAAQGPGGSEFYLDSQARGDRGSINHQEITLGSVLTIPGVSQVLSTSYDPLAQIRVAGLSWFDSADGSADAGYNQTCASNTCAGGGATKGSLTFQKGGGIGGLSVLTEQAPLQIGNRVWFDADQDGIQDADEPAIAGVTVELLDETGAVVGTTTTNAKGEYYFNVTPNSKYTVKFVAPTAGTWNGGSRFGDVPWAEMKLTTQTSGSNTSTDSNPNPATGEAGVNTGAAGANDHSIDAGFIANVSFNVRKELSAKSGPASAAEKFTAVVAAKDFRGNAHALAQSEFDLYLNGDAAAATSSTIVVPVGSLVKVSEKNADSYPEVAISGPAGVTATDGFYPLLAGAAGSVFGFTITNTLADPGSVTVAKDLAGDFELTDAAFAAAVFTVTYEIDGVPTGTLTLNQANNWTAGIDPVPAGATVTLNETAIGDVPGFDWDAPSWSTGEQDNGSAEIKVSAGTAASITLTNAPVQQLAGFTLSKFVANAAAWKALPDTFEFPVEYSLNEGKTWEKTSLTKAANEFELSKLPVGSTVWLREGAVEAHPLPEFAWTGSIFNGPSITAHPTDAAIAVFTVPLVEEPAEITLENSVDDLTGNFSVTKNVTGPGKNFFDEATVFELEYSYTTAAGDTVKTGQVLNGGTYTSELIPTGTEVTLGEIAPTTGLSAGEWLVPKLTVDGYDLAPGASFTIGDDTTLGIVLENPTTVTPTVDLTKGDGVAETGTITHEADTVAEGEMYQVGESREIVIRVQNTGPEPLRNVVLTDSTLSSEAIESLVWKFPGGGSAAGTFDAATGTWSALWPETHTENGVTWAVDDVIVGTAKLTLGADARALAHQNRATVTADGAFSGTTVTDADDYNAFTAGIQVIKYDGNLADPQVRDADSSWVIPAKPLMNVDQDANNEKHAVVYPIGQAQKVRWVVTNTGNTWLTDINLADVTDAGPAIEGEWTADLSAFGGTANYSFTKDGNWTGMLPPGASFFAEGVLTMSKANTLHTNTVTVIGTPIVPETGADGKPTDQPSVDVDGKPVVVNDADGNPVTLTDDDPFNAITGDAPKKDDETGVGGEVIKPGKPGKPEMPGTGGTGGADGTTGVNSDGDLAATGGISPVLAVAVGVLLLIGGALVLFFAQRKRKRS